MKKITEEWIGKAGFDISEDEAIECAKIMEKIRKIIRNYFGLSEK